MKRRTREQRREDYLDVGASLVLGDDASRTSDPSLALSHVKLADVAREAGVTKGALYHIWPSQEAFWTDLLDYLLDNRRLVAADQIREIGDALSTGSGLSLLRSYTTALFDTLKSDPGFYIRTGLFSYIGEGEVGDRLDANFRESVEVTLPLVGQVLRELGRRPIEGTDLTDLVVAVAALLDGLCLQYRISPDRTPDFEVPAEGSDTAESLSLFSVAAEALLLAYTEPVDEEGA